MPVNAMTNEDKNHEDVHIVEQEETLLPLEKVQQIQQWFLKPSTHSDDLERHLVPRTADTASWVQSLPEWEEWLSSSKNVLWLHAGPGVGKSVLTASLIEHFSAPPAPVVYFFFRGNSPESQDVNRFVQSLLWQLLPRSVSLQGILLPLFERATQADGVSTQDLADAFVAGLRSMGRVYLVVDALDEIPGEQAEAVLKHLRQASALENVKILIASRPSIRPLMDEQFAERIELKLDYKQTQLSREIGIFIDEQLRQADMNAKARDSLKDVILARSGGNFLAARIMLDQLVLGTEWVGIYKDQVSPSEHLYTTVLQDQAARLNIDHGAQMRILGYVVFCHRPMRVRELSGLLVAGSLSKSISAAERVVREGCFPLLQIGKDEVVRLLHHSVYEYLVDPDQGPLVNETEIHESLASLSLEAILQGGPYQAKLIIQLPHIQYAQAAWSFHLCHLHHQDPVPQKIVTTLESICQSEISFAGAPSLPTLLHVASYTGLSSLAEQLLGDGDTWLTDLKPVKNRFNNEQKIPWETTPLAIAASSAHAPILKMLWTEDMTSRLGPYNHQLLIDACVNPKGEEGARFLIEKGCTPPSGEDRFGSYRTSLLHFRFPAKILPVLLPHMHEELLIDLITQSAVLARNDTLKAVLSVPYCSKSAPWRSSWTGSPLYQLCGARDKTFFHVESANLLIGHHGDLNQRESPRRMFVDQYHSHRPLPTSGGTVLHALAASWSDENHSSSAAIFEALLKNGADLEVRDDEGQTPLCMLFWGKNVRSVYKPLKVLIGAGADIDVLDGEGDDLLMRVVKTTRDVGALKRLMHSDRHRRDDSPPKWDREYLKKRPYLGHLWENTNGPDGQEEVVEYLLSLGCTVEDGEKAAETILTMVKRSPVALMEKVLDTRSIDAFLQDVLLGFWNAAISRQQEQQEAVLDVLIQAGGDINCRDGQGRTPLMFALTSLSGIDIFAERGADLHARDHLGRGMIHHLAMPSSWPEDCKRVYHSEWTPLPPLSHALTKLLSLGCDVAVVDKQGKTALHYAVSLGRDPNGSNWDVWPQTFTSRYEFLGFLRGLAGHMFLTVEMVASAVGRFFDVAARPVRKTLKTAGNHLMSLMDVFTAAGVVVDLNVVDETGLSPVMVAAMNLDGLGLPCFQILRDHGARMDLCTKEGENVLHLACRARNPTTLGYLIDACPELVHQRDKRGRTPLFDACRSGIVECVALLIEAGADVTARDANECTLADACAEFEADQEEWQKGALFQARHEDWEDHDLTGSPHSVNLAWVGPSQQIEKKKSRGRCLTNPLLAIQAVRRLIQDVDTASVPNASEEGEERDGELDQLIAKQPLIQPEAFLSQCTSVKDLQWVLKQNVQLFKQYEPEEGERKMSSMDRELKGGEAWADRLLKVTVQTGNTEAVRGLLSLTEASENSMAAYFHGLSHQNLFRMAVRYPSSNVAMLRFFLQDYHFQVDPPTLSPKKVSDLARNDTEGFVDHISPSVVHILSAAEHHWHVLALGYLIKHGKPDLNLKTHDGDTPLHLACKSTTPWAAPTVKLLLSSGADHSLPNAEGHLCTRNVALPAVEAVFTSFSISMGGNPTERLALAIGQLDQERVRKAIELGANVSDRIEAPIWRDEEYDAGYSGVVVGNEWPAVPLLAALQLKTPGQDQGGARHEVIRMLVRAGANLAEETDVHDLDVYEEGVAAREQPPRSYWEEGFGEETLLERMPFLHAVFKYVRCEGMCLDVFLDYFEDEVREVMERRGGDKGQTLLLAMCDARVDARVEKGEMHDYTGDEMEIVEGPLPLGYFMRLLDMGADILATDTDGNNALHTLLKNPSMEESHIRYFIDHQRTLPLHHQPDPQGWTPLQLAAKILRPGAMRALIEFPPQIKDQHDRDPEGLTVMHRIAQQAVWAATCAGYSHKRAVMHPESHTDSCLELWRLYLEAGADINALDGTEEGNPPLFYYLTQLCVNQRGTGPSAANFEAFFTKDGKDGNGFRDADLKIRNKKGDTVLHAIVKACEGQWGGKDLEAAGLVKMMVKEYGLDLGEKDGDGRSVVEMIGASGSRWLKSALSELTSG